MYGYGNYNEGGYSRGNYNESGNYGRRGVPGTGRGRRYRGYSGAEESLNEMHEHYGAYSESREAANAGNYGAEQDSKKAFMYLSKASVYDHKEALFHLAFCYIEGNGVSKDPVQGLACLARAADLGNRNAIELIKRIEEAE